MLLDVMDRDFDLFGAQVENACDESRCIPDL